MAKLNFNQIMGGGNNNLLINGSFDVWQRATSQTSSGYYSADRFRFAVSGSSQTVTKQVFTPGQTDVIGAKNYCRVVVVSTAGASNYVYFQQRIEGLEQHSGQNVTVSFWAKANAAKDIAVELTQDFGSGGSPSADVNISPETVTLTTSWAKYSVTIPVPSTAGKTFGTNDDASLNVQFWLDAGSTFNSRTDSLGQQSGTFEFANVKLEEGSVATPFVARHIAQELALCKRYYQKQRYIWSGYATSGVPNYIDFNFPEMRVSPPTSTITAGAAAGFTSGSETFAVLGAYAGRMSNFATATSAGSYYQGTIALDAEL